MTANLICQACESPVDKGDARFVDEETFAFQAALPDGLTLGTYCSDCFQAKVEPDLEIYTEKLEKAKNVNVFFATQSKESRFVRRNEKPIKVENCPDRDETVMRLAFLAAEAGHNMIVDVALKAEKVIDGAYQTSNWSGRAIPATVDEEALKRRP